MKKQILSLLIFSSTFTHTMEKEFSYSSSQISSESKRIQNLRKEKDKFEKQLQVCKIEKKYPSSTQSLTYLFACGFLQHCYSQNFHANESDSDTKCSDFLFNKYQETRLNGYSALGAAMLTKEVSIKRKRIFILQKLINRNFKATQKDKELAELILYDETIRQSKPIIHMLYSQANWSVLPPEIRKHITRYMLQLFKKEFWLLPETLLNDL